MAPPPELSEIGWAVESAGHGGVRIRRSDAWRAGALGCSSGMLLLIALFAAFGGYVACRFLEAPEDGWLRMVALLIPLGFLSILGLMLLAAVWQFLALLVVREEWEASHGRLHVHRRLLGLQHTRDYAEGELLLDPHYGADKRTACWRVLLLAKGRRIPLLQEPDVGISFGGAMPVGAVSQEEAQAIADLLARHTGWPLVAVQTSSLKDLPPALSGELPAILRKQGFSAGLDERMRQTVETPRPGQCVVAMILAAFGGWAFYLVWAFASPWDEQLVMDPMFWIFMVPLVLIGGGLLLLALAILFIREQWTLDRNLLIVTSGVWWRKTEQQYIDGRLVLARVGAHRRGEDGGGMSWEWQLQLQASDAKDNRILYRHADDDSPRALGGLLANATGWPLREAA